MKTWKRILALTLAVCLAIPSVGVSAAGDVTNIETQAGKEISLTVGNDAYTETFSEEIVVDSAQLDEAVAKVEAVSATETKTALYDHTGTVAANSLTSYQSTANASLDLDKAVFKFAASGDNWKLTNEANSIYFYLKDAANTLSDSAANLAEVTFTKVEGDLFRISKGTRYLLFWVNKMHFDSATLVTSRTDLKYDFTIWEKKETIEEGDLVPGYSKVTELQDGGEYLISYVWTAEDGTQEVFVLYPVLNGQTSQSKLVGDSVTETTGTLTITPVGTGTTSVTVNGETYTINVTGDEAETPEQPEDTAFKDTQELVDSLKENAALAEVYFGDDQVFDGTKVVDASDKAAAVKEVNTGSIILRFKPVTNSEAGVVLGTKAASLSITQESQLNDTALDRTAFYMKPDTAMFRFVYPHTWAGWNVSFTDGNWHTVVLSSLPSGKSMRLTIDGVEVWSNTADSNRGMFSKHTNLDQVTIGAILDASGNPAFGFKGEISHVIVTSQEISDADAIKISKAGCTIPVTSGSAISQMFTSEVADTSWVFTGGEDVKGGFEQTRGERNYSAMFEKYDRGGSSGSFSVNRQRFVVNAGKAGQTLSDIVETYETRIAAYEPKAAVYLVGSDDWKKGDDGLAKFKTDLTSFIEKSLDLRADDQGFAVIQKPFAVNSADDNAVIEKYCAAVDEIVASYEEAEAKFEHIFVVDHYTSTKEDTAFLAGGINAEGKLTAEGHMIIGRQFTMAVAKCTETAFNNANAVASKTEVKMPEEYLDIVPTVTAAKDSLNVMIPEGNGTVWKYELDMDGTIVSGTKNAASFTIDGLTEGKSYVLKLQSQDGTKQLTTVKGIIAAGEAAVENILQTSEMNEYQQEIAAKAAGDEPLTWLFMGDSITHATTTSGYDGVVQVVEDYIANELDRTEDIVVNAGVNNATTEHTVEQLKYRLENYKPDILAIQLGTNDAIFFDENTDGSTGSVVGQQYQSGVVEKGYEDKFDKYRAEMQQIIDKARELNPEVTVILRSPTPSLDGRHILNRSIDLYVAQMKALAEKNDCMFIDQYTALQGEVSTYSWMRTQNNTFFFTDTLHPGTNGHRIMAQWFIKACGLWTEDSAITNLLYEMPISDVENDFVPAVTVDRAAGSITLDTAALETGSSTDLGQIILTAKSKTNGQSYSTSVKDGEASVVLANLPKETYEVTIAGYAKSAAQRIEFTSVEVTMGDVKNIELSVGGRTHTEAVTADTVVGTVADESIATVEKVSTTVQNIPLHNHKTATGTISAAFDTAVNNGISLEDAEFIFTAAGEENKWQISNKDQSVYLNNATSGPSNFFKSTPADVTMEKVDGGFRIITNGRIAIFHYTNSRFDANGAYTENSAWTHEFTLLKKQETVSEEDVVPGYQEAATIEEGSSYLITYISPNNEVIVLYPANGADQGSRTKLVGTPVTNTTYELVITPKAEGTTSVTVDGITYEITVVDRSAQPLDKAALEAAVAEAKAVAEELYTVDSLNELTEKIAAAEAVIADAVATNLDVENALADLNEAKADLEEIEYPQLPAGAELLKAGSIPASDDTVTQGQPFAAGTGGSQMFRIPALITLENGNLVAAADARWNTHQDAGGLDTIASVSEDNGETWKYSFPIYFPDSNSNIRWEATTAIDPVLVQGPDGTIYCIADMNPSGVTTLDIMPGKGTGYVEIDGKQRLALTRNYVKPTDEQWSTYGDPETYEYYVGDFENGYAPVIKKEGNVTTKWVVDEWYNIYLLNEAGEKTALTQTQVDSDNVIQQNVFYQHSVLHVYSTGYLWLVKSYDNGMTWEDPEILNTQIKRTPNEIALLASPGQGMVTSGGDIIIPFYDHGDNQENASVIWSGDNGATWHRSNDVQGLWSSESEVVELNDGVLRMFFRNGTGFICYADITKNEAGEWVMGQGIQTDIAVTSTCNVTAIRYSEKVGDKIAVIVGCPSGSGRANGKLYTFLVSEDNSMEHFNTYSVNQGTYQYSCLTELENGDLGLLWENGTASMVYETFSAKDVLGTEVTVEIAVGGVYKETVSADTITQQPDAEIAAASVETVEYSKILLHNHVADVNSSVEGSFSAQPNEAIELEEAVFTMQASGSNWKIYNKATKQYLTNDTYANTFFESTGRDMLIEAIEGGYFRIRKADGTRPILFYLPKMDFNANSAYVASDQYNLVLLEKQETVSEDDIVPGFKRAVSVEDGKEYLISYLMDENVIVLYPQNGTAAQTKLVGDCVNGSRKELTIRGIGDGTTTAVIEGVTYTIIVGTGETTEPKPPVEECEHLNTKVVGKTDATCTELGCTGDTICEDCGETLAEGTIIPAAGHDWSDWKVTEEATTEKAGKEERTCSVCDETESRDIPKLEPEPPAEPPVIDKEEAKPEISGKAYNSVSLKWKAVAAAESYKVVVYAAGNTETPVAAYGDIKATDFTVSGLKENAEYLFKIYAVNEAGTSQEAMSVTAKTSSKPGTQPSQSTQPTAPSAPATGDSAQILTWTAAAFVMAAGACAAFFRRRKTK